MVGVACVHLKMQCFPLGDKFGICKNVILQIRILTILYVSQVSRDPSSQKGQVKSNTLTCAARHNGWRA